MTRDDLADVVAAIEEADRLDPGWRWGDLVAEARRIEAEECGWSLVEEAMGRLPGSEAVVEAGSCSMDQECGEPAFDPATNAEALEAARRLAGAGLGSPALLEDARRAFDDLMPRLDPYRTLARLLDADVVASLAEGDTPGAVLAVRAMLGLAGVFDAAPLLVPHLVAMAIRSMAASRLWELVEVDPPGDESLVALRDDLAAAARRPTMRTFLRGERAYFHETLAAVGAGTVPLPEVAGMIEGFEAPDDVPEEVVAMILASGPFHGREVERAGPEHVAANHAWGLRWLNEAVRIAGQPMASQVAPWLVLTERHREAIDRADPRQAIALTQTKTLPTMAGLVHREWIGLCTLAVLVEAVRVRKAAGAWPTSLDEVAGSLDENLLDQLRAVDLRIEVEGDCLRVVQPEYLASLADPTLEAFRTRMRGQDDRTFRVLWDGGRARRVRGGAG